MTAVAGTLRLVVLTIVVLLVGWQIAVAAAGEALLKSGRAAQAHAVDPLLSSAWSMDAAERLAAIDPARAAVVAREALRRNPLDQRALTVLAVAGPEADTSALMSLSATLGWRYQLAQIWLAQAGMAIGDGTLAATRIDALARTMENPVLAWPLVDRAVALPAIRGAMAERIAEKPSWRGLYLSRHVVPTDAAIAVRQALLRDLARSGAPPTVAELLPYVRTLQRNGQGRSAFDMWANFVAAPHAWSGLLYDGAFRQVKDDEAAFPFAWGMLDAEGGSAVSEDGAGVLLQSDGSAAAPLIHQVRLLPPGRYRLVADAEIDTAQDQPPAFAWFVGCGATQLIEGVGADVRSVRNGTASYTFAVPAGCVDQTISVDAVPGMPGTSSSATLRAARIDRIG